MAFDFPTTPTVGQIYNNYVWDGEKWLLRTAPTNPKKNYIVNGAMMVSQEWGITALNTPGRFPADMFSYLAAGTTGVIDFGQIPLLSTSGSPNRIRFTVTTVDASVAATDVAGIVTRIEGTRVSDLKLGTAAAMTFILQFGVRAPAGTYCIAFVNAAQNRTYVAEYVIAAGEANTDIVKSVTLAGDVTGTWARDSSVGLEVRWCLMAGTSYQGAANAWSGGQPWGSASQFNFMGTFGNVFELFDVSLTEGSIAPPFAVPDYAIELSTCQRYFEIATVTVQANGTGSVIILYPFKASKRIAPTMATVGSPSLNNAAGPTFNSTTAEATGLQFTTTASAGYVAAWTFTANARL